MHIFIAFDAVYMATVVTPPTSLMAICTCTHTLLHMWTYTHTREEWLGEQFHGRKQTLFVSFWVCCVVGAPLYITAFIHSCLHRWYTAIIVSISNPHLLTT